MPLPAFDSDGFLPPGIHDCTHDDMKEAFGKFTTSDRRIRLTEHLLRYLQELRRSGVAEEVIVNGSYVTGKDEPNDIDLLVIFRADIDLGETVPPFKYNPRSKRYVRRNFPFDCFFGFPGDDSSTKMINVFSKCRNHPGRTKGMIRVAL